MIISQEDLDNNFDQFNTNDILHKFIPFRIFRLKDFSIERIPVFGDECWINSTEVFPRRFEAVRNLYESEFIKVVLHKNLQTNQFVRNKFNMFNMNIKIMIIIMIMINYFAYPVDIKCLFQVAIKFIKVFKSTCDLKIKNSQDRIEREISIIQVSRIRFYDLFNLKNLETES